MPERANSFAPTIPGVFSVLVARSRSHFCKPRAADSCVLEQPSQPAVEGTRWSAHYDRAKAGKTPGIVGANEFARSGIGFSLADESSFWSKTSACKARCTESNTSLLVQ